MSDRVQYLIEVNSLPDATPTDGRGAIEGALGSGGLRDWVDLSGDRLGIAHLDLESDGHALLVHTTLEQAGWPIASHKVESEAWATAKAGLVQLADPDLPRWEDWSSASGISAELEARLDVSSEWSDMEGLDLPDIPGFRWDMAWVYDPNAAAVAGLSAPAPAGTDEIAAAGKGKWLWNAVRIAWKVGGKVGRYARDPRVQAILWAADRAVLRPMKREWAKEARQRSYNEVQRRQALHIARVREARLNQGSAARRARYREYYNRIDRLIEINR